MTHRGARQRVAWQIFRGFPNTCPTGFNCNFPEPVTEQTVTMSNEKHDASLIYSRQLVMTASICQALASVRSQYGDIVRESAL